MSDARIMFAYGRGQNQFGQQVVNFLEDNPETKAKVRVSHHLEMTSRDKARFIKLLSDVMPEIITNGVQEDYAYLFSRVENNKMMKIDNNEIFQLLLEIKQRTENEPSSSSSPNNSHGPDRQEAHVSEALEKLVTRLFQKVKYLEKRLEKQVVISENLSYTMEKMERYLKSNYHEQYNDYDDDDDDDDYYDDEDDDENAPRYNRRLQRQTLKSRSVGMSYRPQINAELEEMLLNGDIQSEQIISMKINNQGKNSDMLRQAEEEAIQEKERRDAQFMKRGRNRDAKMKWRKQRHGPGMHDPEQMMDRGYSNNQFMTSMNMMMNQRQRR